MVDYNARLYDPSIGRFLSVDPLIAHPGSTQSINPYSYVENNPLNKTDPTGMMESCVGGKRTGCNVSTKDSSVTINPNKGTMTVNHADGSKTTVNVGKAAASAAAAGARAMFGSGVTQKGGGAGQGATPTNVHNKINTHKINPTQSDTAGGDHSSNPFGSSLFPNGGLLSAIKCIWTCNMPGNGDPVENVASTGPLGLVKNVRSQSYTRQLRDYSEYAQKENLQFHLHLRTDTKVSGPLQQQIDRGLIRRLDTPPW